MRYVESVVPRLLGIAALLTLAACQSAPAAKRDGQVAIPAAAQSAFEQAAAAQRNEQWDVAEREFSELAERYPDYSGPQLNLALLYAQTQKPQQAETHFKRALQLNPDNLVNYDQYGIWLRAQGRFQNAETIYRQALARDANHADTQLDLAILYDLYMGKPQEALAYYQRYLELVNDDKSPVRGWVVDLQRRLDAAGKTP